MTGVQTCALDRKSTRLNSSHTIISYAVFCLKKKKNAACRIFEMVNEPPLQTHASGKKRLFIALPPPGLALVSARGLPSSSLAAFFFNDTATTENLLLSLPAVLPI